MKLLDIFLALPLIWSFYKGFKDGILVQLGGLAGLVLGIWLAVRFGGVVGGFFAEDTLVATIIGFIVVLGTVLIVVGIAGRLLRGILRFSGLGIVDQFGGSILSFIKTVIICGVFLYAFDLLNRRNEWVDKSYLEESFLYTKLIGAAEFTFPYFTKAKEQLFEEWEVPGIDQLLLPGEDTEPEADPDPGSTGIDSDTADTLSREEIWIETVS